jgi:hypothetical protein
LIQNGKAFSIVKCDQVRHYTKVVNKFNNAHQLL